MSMNSTFTVSEKVERLCQFLVDNAELEAVDERAAFQVNVVTLVVNLDTKSQSVLKER